MRPPGAIRAAEAATGRHDVSRGEAGPRWKGAGEGIRSVEVARRDRGKSPRGGRAVGAGVLSVGASAPPAAASTAHGPANDRGCGPWMPWLLIFEVVQGPAARSRLPLGRLASAPG